MYIILSTRARRALRSWTYLDPSPRSTAFVAQVRDELAKSYPDDDLVVLCTAPRDEAVPA